MAEAERSWRRELVVLHMRSTRTLNQLDRASESLRQVEQELEAFLDSYYAQVGGLVDELQVLEQQLPDAPPPDAAGMPPAPLPGLDSQVKTLYRKLVRQCHPDTAGESETSARAIRHLNAAYAQRDIGELWKLQWELERDTAAHSPQRRVAQLKAHYEQMQDALNRVEARRQALLDSPGYALMQRAVQLRLCGQDFMELVKAHLSRRIAQKRYQARRAGCSQSAA